MSTTLIIAKTIGIYFMVSGLFVLLNRRTLAQLLKDLFDHRAVTYIIGAIMVIAGGALVLSNKNVDGISTFIEVISWAILIKGIFYIFFPEIMYDMAKNMSRATFALGGLMIAAVGIYLTFGL